MIALLRIDERLIHGQVATSWSKALDIDTIVCASDEAAQNPLKKKMLLIAAPPGKKTHVRSVDEVIGLLQDPRAERMKIFLLTDNPKDALKLVSALGLKNVNLGNYRKRFYVCAVGSGRSWCIEGDQRTCRGRLCPKPALDRKNVPEGLCCSSGKG